jgi:hypothetical protein
MGFLRRLFGGGPGPESDEAPAQSVEDDRQSVVIWLRLQDPAFESEREQVRVFALEDRLMRTLDASGAGEHDTNDLERGYLALRLLGPSADAIVDVVRPLLAEAPAGTYLAVRRGPPGTGEERLDLES